ncbi:putative BTB/POZ domain-containing protein [Acanthamoeba polyphaga mimivirus]|uniref:BTB/POZ domain-containing protein n=1 Tax=Acanthamoeba polyphaga mimivirus Kroon TaxID=3069720 RepID=A0A0G2Y273_9VIRU|nr:putative BTB/POZ domain-containing protein [Acanthamoeba polyphaga mimivirus]AKI79840.1 putative BTB/POZ domain-containing protein [Acanthamoeba polyphaga mimivirus Kroon]
MDKKKLFQYTLDRKFTDLELTLVDSNDTLTMYLHKVILSLSCPYFETIFSSSFSDSVSDKFKMEVLNVYVMADIINSFYIDDIKQSQNLSEVDYQLLCVQSRNFLGLGHKIYNLEKIIFPENKFDQLFDTIDSCIGYTKETMSILFYNMPMDYDLSKLPIKFLKKMLKISRYFVLCINDNKLELHNNYSCFYIGPVRLNHNCKLLYSPIYHKYLIVNDTIHLIDTETDLSSISFYNNRYCCKNTVLSTDNRYVYSVYSNSTIRKFLTETTELIGVWYKDGSSIGIINKNQEPNTEFDDHPKKIMYSTPYDYIVIQYGNNLVCYKCLDMSIRWEMDNVCLPTLSQCEKYIICLKGTTKNQLCVIDIEKNLLKFGPILENCKYICNHDNTTVIIIYDIKFTGSKIKEYDWTNNIFTCENESYKAYDIYYIEHIKNDNYIIATHDITDDSCISIEKWNFMEDTTKFVTACHDRHDYEFYIITNFKAALQKRIKEYIDTNSN